MSSLGNLEPRSRPMLELRRLSHAAVVTTTYLDRNTDEEPQSLEESRDEARREGYEHGYAEGLAKAAVDAAALREEHTIRIENGVSALNKLISDFEDAHRQLLQEIQAAAPKLVFQLVEQLLGRELELSKSPGKEAIARALAFDSSEGKAKVRLNPADLETISDLSEFNRTREIELIADSSVEVGGAIAEVDNSVFDARLSTALERVRQVIGSTRELGDQK